MGRKEPFWSVLTHNEYLTANIDDAALDRLYQSGARDADLIDLFCTRTQTQIHRGVCLELGCGVGRVTKHLAERFEKVIAVDISEGNLSQCKAIAKKARLSNIEYVLLQSPDDLGHLPEFDFFYSTIVLQHNPPPIQKLQLDQLLHKLRRGGGFLFQTQTHQPGYEFIVSKYLASEVDTMDMHSLPMHVILALIEERGHRLREAASDMWTGRIRLPHLFRPRASLEVGSPAALLGSIPLRRRLSACTSERMPSLVPPVRSARSFGPGDVLVPCMRFGNLAHCSSATLRNPIPKARESASPHGRSSLAWAQSWPVLARPRPGSSTGAGVSSAKILSKARCAREGAHARASGARRRVRPSRLASSG